MTAETFLKNLYNKHEHRIRSEPLLQDIYDDIRKTDLSKEEKEAALFAAILLGWEVSEHKAYEYVKQFRTLEETDGKENKEV